MTRQRRATLVLALALLAALTSLALAQADDPHADLRRLLDGVASHPGLRAAEAAAEAAALRADAVRSPVSLSLEVSFQRLQVEPASEIGRAHV